MAAAEGNGCHRKKLMFSELFKETSNRINESSISSSPIISSNSQHQDRDDEDVFMAELTRQMAHSMLDENVDQITGLHTSKDDNINSTELAVSNKRGSMIQSKKRHNSYGAPARPFSPVSCPGAFHQRLNSGSGISCWVLFLGGNGSTNGSNSTRGGTGVFLPRLTPDPYHTRNKRSATRRCSTVLIPTKVMQVLQLHYNKINVDASPKTTLYYNRPGAENLPAQYLKRNLRETQYHSRYLKETKEHHQDIGLPQEWTY